MTLQAADPDTTVQRSSDPLLSWLLPSAVFITLLGAAFLAAPYAVLSLGQSEALGIPQDPVFGSITAPSLAIGERPFAYLEFDWPDGGVPGFEPLQEQVRLVADSIGR